ncbi:hypothetical protein [uncultured Campylobacter sp.]|nr:hypothetical protein [uncultured Campylobacter sp.]
MDKDENKGRRIFEDNCKNEEKFSCKVLKNINNTGSDGAISIAE